MKADYQKRMRNKRLLLIATLVLVGGALLTLVFQSFSGAMVYFHTPTEVMQKTVELVGKKVRIGGMVQAGSLSRKEGTLEITFDVTDGETPISVYYKGVTPDLFREGQGVVVEGEWLNTKPFIAHTILAKHSEDYMPVEMNAEAIQKSRENILKSLQ
ncbi:CcmE/CycJ protein [Magnetococcus marinus MC-1]|uniref:Cytochrome c-type biogenesis protein CcmE n=1 Tax=Magnetococcus marinus (strain ATCC BAA-1437 / JCM 17883 / MC-1) TaxID=156889 RepID=A0LDE3_MAGMM|nr:cytochrome c maturation protein CcmE [Magnetococcus marinus]ABK45986.1 CcmE/CycJ protein [Magnetococcus marinus MC-1]